MFFLNDGKCDSVRNYMLFITRAVGLPNERILTTCDCNKGKTTILYKI
jgi:hypothetical protein